MANLSNYAENKVLDLLFKNTSFTAPQAFIAYFNNAITDASVPTEVTGILGSIETLMNTIQKKNK